MPTKAKRKPNTDELLTIKGLADRWGGTVEVTKQKVRAGGVPFFSLVPTDMRIQWAYVLFRLEAIKEYERLNSVAFESNSPIPREPEVSPKAKAGDWDWRR